jgi:hypothetical protein
MKHSWEQTLKLLSMFNQRTVTYQIFDRQKKIEDEYKRKNRIILKIKLSIELFFTPEIQLSNCSVRITKNKYPYNFEDDIEHYIIWTEDDIESVVDSFSDQALIEKHNFVIFSNSPEVRSIKRNHYHLLIRRI